MLTISKSDSRIYRLQSEILIPFPLSVVFDFFAKAENLEVITPPFLNFQILTPKPIEMHQGTLIDYEISLHRIPLSWKTEITDWEPPHRFVDNQIKGPYRLWRHEHTFQEQEKGTLVIDKVDYSVYGGPLINWLFVRRDLERIFRYRHERLKEFTAEGIKS
ncbi:SRPBCC family protein [Gimesia aquarii]|uniref:Polyketide cyclase / dehydrase and lipid transport n=1 Tax=Gimesia aquarii TaxID=2527964 RepID=A0A517VS57_9PLAN|nr:SRPBCC family protein [Gimesia aquarii]QDT95800.1 Polyketide cyclase / dehydrase and lipid transport [Gimesia aquarii]